MAEVLHTQVAIVGGGAAGLAAAQLLLGRGTPFFLAERDGFLGGRWFTGAPSPHAPPSATLPPAPHASVRLHTSAVGLYEDAAGKFLVTVGITPEGPRLSRVYAERFLLSVGGHSSLLSFGNNDLPGVFAGRAASLLLRRYGLVVGDAVALAGRGEELYQLVPLLERAGSRVVAIVDVGSGPPPGAPETAAQGTVLKAHGRGEVTGMTFLRAGTQRRVKCDALIVSQPPTPSFELARQGGARVAWSAEHSQFVVEANLEGRTAAPSVYVAGEGLGPMSALEASESGERAARSILGELRGVAS